MSGLLENFYEMVICALVGKVKNYGCTAKYNRDLPYKGTKYNVTQPNTALETVLTELNCGKNSGFVTAEPNASQLSTLIAANVTEWYTQAEIKQNPQSDNPMAEIMLENNECALGLLSQPPIWYHGDWNITISGVSKTNLYPALMFDDDVSTATSFLNVMEIPNDPMPYTTTVIGQISTTQNYFKNVNDADYTPDSTKLFNGGYWPSYRRFGIQKRLKDVASSIQSEYNQTTGKQENWIQIEGTGNVTDVLTEKAAWQMNSANTDYERIINLYNSGFLFVAENTDTYDWPAVKYFGFFKSVDDTRYMRFSSQVPYLIDSQLYYWGELTENNKWYHATSDTTPQTGKVYYTYNTLTQTYEVFEGSSFVSGTTYYEKTGIVVASTQGGLFNKSEFVISWDGDVITNTFS